VDSREDGVSCATAGTPAYEIDANGPDIVSIQRQLALIRFSFAVQHIML